MAIDKLSSDWIFSNFPKYHIIFWTNQLKHGSFMRAPSTHSKEGDSFQIWFNYRDSKELTKILEQLGVNLQKTTSQVISKGRLSTQSVSDDLKVPELPEYEQPQHIKINKTPCFCWINNGEILIRISGSKDGNFHKVTEVDFRNCIKLEKLITETNLDSYINHDHKKSFNCISKETYPELYKI